MGGVPFNHHQSREVLSLVPFKKKQLNLNQLNEELNIVSAQTNKGCSVSMCKVQR